MTAGMSSTLLALPTKLLLLLQLLQVSLFEQQKFDELDSRDEFHPPNIAKRVSAAVAAAVGLSS
jgi:hypothetical protein